MSTHLFPATQKPDFDTDHFNELSAKRNHLDYQCYMFLCKILNDLPEQYYSDADELLTNRDRACDEALHYLTTGDKSWTS